LDDKGFVGGGGRGGRRAATGIEIGFVPRVALATTFAEDTGIGVSGIRGFSRGGSTGLREVDGRGLTSGLLGGRGSAAITTGLYKGFGGA
jgi:hypothetical protein